MGMKLDVGESNIKNQKIKKAATLALPPDFLLLPAPVPVVFLRERSSSHPPIPIIIRRMTRDITGIVMGIFSTAPSRTTGVWKRPVDIGKS